MTVPSASPYPFSSMRIHCRAIAVMSQTLDAAGFGILTMVEENSSWLMPET